MKLPRCKSNHNGHNIIIALFILSEMRWLHTDLSHHLCAPCLTQKACTWVSHKLFHVMTDAHSFLTSCLLCKQEQLSWVPTLSAGSVAAEGLSTPGKTGCWGGCSWSPGVGQRGELHRGRAIIHLQAISFKSAGRVSTCFLNGSWRSLLSAQMSLGYLERRNQGWSSLWVEIS